jgi:hypothetical protein
MALMETVYEGTRVTVDTLVECLNDSLSRPPAKSRRSPNKADPLTTESFSATLDALTDPFNEVLKDYYGSK